MTDNILGEGGQIQVPGVHRGMLLAHTEEGWTARCRSFMRVRFMLYSIVLGGGTLFFVGATLFSGQPLVSLCVIILVVAQVLLARSYHSALATLDSGGPVPGVYEHGVQMPVFPVYVVPLFIPWTNVEDAWVRRSRLAAGTLFIAVKDSRWRWRFPVVILGDEGVDTAIARARGPVSLPPLEVDETPPRLVIYGADGVRSESVPNDY